MLRAEVQSEVCQACAPCPARRVCKTKAIMQIDAGEPAFIDVTRCRGCGTCLPACPHAAIALSNTQPVSAHSVQPSSA